MMAATGEVMGCAELGEGAHEVACGGEEERGWPFRPSGGAGDTCPRASWLLAWEGKAFLRPSKTSSRRGVVERPDRL